MAVLLMVALNMTAQEKDFEVRGRIENVTNYHLLSSRNGLRKVGSIDTAPLACTGTPKIPVILVQFSDLSFTVDETPSAVNQIYHDFFNAGEGISPSTSFCSVREYFRDQSDNLFIPQFDIIGPVTISKNYAYYGKDSLRTKDIHIKDFYREACQQAILTNVDWSQYDNDENGVVDFIFFIYAGHGQNQEGMGSETIWPKEEVAQLTVQGKDHTVTFGANGCTCELYKDQIDGIGSCVHELCHGFGLPDFYDYNYKAYGLDYWDLMDSGCYKLEGTMPIGLSAYERDFLGWRKLVELNPDSAYSLVIKPLELGGVAYKVVNKANKNEYFILENRQNIGMDQYMGYVVSSQYDKYGANHGLMISHVNYSQSVWNTNKVNTTDQAHQHMTLVPADNELISNNKGIDATWARSAHGDLYPSDNNVTEITSYAVFTGGTLGQTIDNIVEHEDGTISVDINGGKVDNPEDPDSLEEPDIPEIA